MNTDTKEDDGNVEMRRRLLHVDLTHKRQL